MTDSRGPAAPAPLDTNELRFPCGCGVTRILLARGDYSLETLYCGEHAQKRLDMLRARGGAGSPEPALPRFRPGLATSGSPVMVENLDGAYVRYDDMVRLLGAVQAERPRAPAPLEQVIEIDQNGKVLYPTKCGECSAPVRYERGSLKPRYVADAVSAIPKEEDRSAPANDAGSQPVRLDLSATSGPAAPAPLDLQAFVNELAEALAEARDCLRFFHREPGWAEYQSSPEMKRINSALDKWARTPQAVGGIEPAPEVDK